MRSAFSSSFKRHVQRSNSASGVILEGTFVEFGHGDHRCYVIEVLVAEAHGDYTAGQNDDVISAVPPHRWSKN